MRVCIYGAGAIGGYYAARLAQAGHQVAVVARGAHLKAMQDKGLTLCTRGGDFCVTVTATEDPKDLGPQDVVIVTLKANALMDLARDTAPLLGPDTALVFAQNGIPWWYNLGLPASAPKTPDLSWLDPDGALHKLKGRSLGGVIFVATEVIEPGVVRLNSHQDGRLVMGEFDDADTARVRALREAFIGAGIGSVTPKAIREAVWTKLMGNMTGSVLSGLVGRPVRDITGIPFAELLTRIRKEAYAIPAAHGFPLEIPEPRRASAGHTVSILQDYQRKRPMEIDVLVIAPLAFARIANLSTPSLDLMGSLVAQKAIDAGLYTLTRAFPV